jgi:hypothetical protein
MTHNRHSDSPDAALALDHTELPLAQPGDPFHQEWNYYRTQVARLLDAGQEYRWVLIKAEQIVGVYDTREAAKEVALQRYLLQPVLIHQIRSREPLLRGPSVLWRCPS